MTDPQRMDGYVIVPPVSPWDEPHRDEIELFDAYSMIGQTPTEAWRRHIQTNGIQLDDGEFATRVQHWHDRGYRLVKVTVVILRETDV